MYQQTIFEKFSDAIQELQDEYAGGYEFDQFWLSDEQQVTDKQFKEFINEPLYAYLSEDEIEELLLAVKEHQQSLDTFTRDPNLISQEVLIKLVPFWNSQHNQYRILNM